MFRLCLLPGTCFRDQLFSSFSLALCRFRALFHSSHYHRSLRWTFIFAVVLFGVCGTVGRVTCRTIRLIWLIDCLINWLLDFCTCGTLGLIEGLLDWLLDVRSPRRTSWRRWGTSGWWQRPSSSSFPWSRSYPSQISCKGPRLSRPWPTWMGYLARLPGCVTLMG